MKIKESDKNKYIRFKCHCGFGWYEPLSTALCYANHMCMYCHSLNPPMVRNKTYWIYQWRKILRLWQGKSVPGVRGKANPTGQK